MAIQAAIPYIIAALSAGAQAYNTKQTADRQEDVALAGLDRQRLKQREADQRLNEELRQLESSSPEDERAQSLEQFMQALRSSASQRGGSGDVPGASGRYAEDAVTSRAGIQNYGDKLSGILSRIRGGVGQRQNESIGFNRAGSDVDAVRRASQGEDYLTRLKMGATVRDPWLDAAAQMGMGIAGGMAGSAGADDNQLWMQAMRAGNEKVPLRSFGAAGESAFGNRPKIFSPRGPQ